MHYVCVCVCALNRNIISVLCLPVNFFSEPRCHVVTKLTHQFLQNLFFIFVKFPQKFAVVIIIVIHRFHGDEIKSDLILGAVCLQNFSPSSLERWFGCEFGVCMQACE